MLEGDVLASEDRNGGIAQCTPEKVCLAYRISTYETCLF
jgi:hypothetical protein